MTNRLKVHVLNPFIKAENCSICFETLRESVELKCGHEFHLKCIDIWIDNYQKNCPLCRYIFIPSPPPSPLPLPPPPRGLLNIIIPPPPIIIPLPPIEFPSEASNTQSNSTQSNTSSNTPSGSPNSPIVIIQQQQLTCCIVQ